MAASGLLKSSSGPIPPLSKPTSRSESFQRIPSHRVYFNEIPPSKHQNCWDNENSKINKDWDSTDDNKKHHGCGLCCAWTSLVVSSLVLVLLFLGALLFSFLEDSLPEFRIKRLSITKLEVTTKDQITTLNSEFHLLINATNKNDRYNLSYGLLKAKFSSYDLDLGGAEVAPFEQGPRKVRELNLQAGVKKSVVNRDDAERLKLDFEEEELVIDLVFKGSISFDFGGQMLKGMPLIVFCKNVEQNQIDNGMQPQCRVKMLSFM